MSRSRITSVLDWLALVLLVAAVAIQLTGGLSFRAGGMRVTARGVDRPLAAALVLVVLRVVLDRRTRPFAGSAAAFARARARVFSPALDEAAPLPHETRWRRRGLAALGFALFGAVLLFPQLRQMDSVPDLGDPLFSMWRIGWIQHKLAGDPRPLFSPNIFYPYPYTLTYSDSMLLPSLTTIPWLALGLHPVVAYNLVLVLSFVASAFTMYLLMEHLTGSPPAAFVSGLLFGFYPYRFEHYSHFELQMTYCMPLALLVLHKLLASPTVRRGLAFGLLAASQLYSSMYYAVFFAFYTATVTIVDWAFRRTPVRRLIVPMAVAGATALLLAVPLARTYSAAKLGDRDVQTVKYYSAEAADYLRAHDRSAMWGDRGLPGRQPERALFPGAMVLLLALVALVPRVGTTRVVYAVVLIVMFEISRGFNSVIYPPLYEWLSFMRGLRVPARASVLVGLTLAVLAGFGVRRLLTFARGWTPVAVGALAILIGVDLHPRLRLEPVWPEPPPIYGLVAGVPDIVLAEFPFGGTSRAFTSNVPFMYFSLWHWANMVNGYSGHAPESQHDYEIGMSNFPDERSLELLRARGVTHVTVNCALYRGGCDRLVEAVDAVPALHLVTSARWQGQAVRLYELRR